MEVIEAGATPSTPADPARYSGEVWTDALIEGAPPGNINIARVAFSPGARMAWHTHPFGQILVVVSGVGLICKNGGTAVRLRPGDSVAIAPGERHWHGATPDHAFTHYAIQGADSDGRMADWQELVKDVDYEAAADGRWTTKGGFKAGGPRYLSLCSVSGLQIGMVFWKIVASQICHCWAASTSPSRRVRTRRGV